MPVKVIVYLPTPAVEALEGLAAKRETTKTEILRHAISLEQQLDHEIDQGARILIEKDDKFSELIVRP
ncbi:MAG TPA: ribbon-helix-helix protein, CopG family [Rubrobacter sp.]|nr:ribbon-helix-helix protein, CopG family [Rubrobacter sp.]